MINYDKEKGHFTRDGAGITERAAQRAFKTNEPFTCDAITAIIKTKP